ncbi:NAD(P)H-binding protein [Herbidospora sp. NBRC 101105]|uniref:NAD(P)H-binding protein n=1 Tax=Herbidospora sp. NBRC 101105 TaxID=3032195 RepID=UPI00249FFEAF|nr:NAD(P)H-binding protein [Herbidospora sp. NBRC 101105]GLX95937.1 NAD(P)-dependent oxidoreductase [Herbidospora sp. NBRC 101105]
MYAVTAATGQLGRLVLDRLKGDVVAVVRDPSRLPVGVEARHGDYDDPHGLQTAFAGVDRLLLISSPELDAARRTAQHRNVLDAAVAAGVTAVVYTSFLGADNVTTGMTEAHHATERAIVASGLAYTILRNPFYGEAFLPQVTDGVIRSSTGGRGLNTAFRDDLAQAAANALTGEGHLGRAYDLTGPLWSYPEVAAALGVAYEEVHDAGPGPMAWLNGLVRAGALERQTGDLESLLGRPAETVAERLTT